MLLNWNSLNNIRTFHILWFLIAHVAYMVDSAMCEVPSIIKEIGIIQVKYDGFKNSKIPNLNKI